MSMHTLTPSKTQTLFEEKFCHILYDPATNVLTAKWIGFLKLEDTKRACKLMIPFIREKKITNQISDQTELKVLSMEVQEYLVKECFVDFEKNGLRKVAVLVSDDVFTQASVNGVNAKAVKNKLTISTFNTIAKCMEWFNK